MQFTEEIPRPAGESAELRDDAFDNLHDVADLRQGVLSLLNCFLCDLLAQFDCVERFVLCQAAEDGELRAQHVAVGHCGYDFLCCRFDFLHRL